MRKVILAALLIASFSAFADNYKAEIHDVDNIENIVEIESVNPVMTLRLSNGDVRLEATDTINILGEAYVIFCFTKEKTLMLTNGRYTVKELEALKKSL